MSRDIQGGMPPAANFTPARMVDLELGAAISALPPARDTSGQPYARALVLARLGGQPIGIAEIPLVVGGLGAGPLRQAVWDRIGPAVNARLVRAGHPTLAELPPGGLAGWSGWFDTPARQLVGAPLNATVLIATRDRPESLAACLESLLAMDHPGFDIVVVDSAPSNDATRDMLRTRFGGLPGLRYVREDRPGLAIAHNRGLAEVTTSIVAFTDDDVLLDPGWLREIMAEFQADPAVACVTGMIVPLEIETAPQGWIEEFGGFGKGFERQVFDLAEHRRDHPLFPYAAGMFGSGANMAFRTGALRRIGGFDPALGAGTTAQGADDLAAFLEIILSGHRLVYQPAALLRHQHRRDYAGLRRQVRGYGVGLGAYLTKLVLDHPDRLPELLRRAPVGLRHALSPNSTKNRKKQGSYPAELTRLELLGLVQGPLAYLRSRWETRRLRRPAAAQPQVGSG